MIIIRVPRISSTLAAALAGNRDSVALASLAHTSYAMVCSIFTSCENFHVVFKCPALTVTRNKCRQAAIPLPAALSEVPSPAATI